MKKFYTVWLTWLVIIGGLAVATRVHAQGATAERLLALTNVAREQAGAEPLQFSDSLLTAARRHSNDMAERDVLSHTGADGSAFWQRAQLAGYPLAAGAENVLARGDTNPQAAFEQWFNSDGHRTNMLNPAYRDVGIAYAQAASGRYFFTMILGQSFETMAQNDPPTNTPVAVATITPMPTSIPPTNLPTATLLPTQTATLNPTVAPTDSLIATLIAPLPTETAEPTREAPASTIVTQLLATNTPIPTITPTPIPDILLLYNAEGFSLMNVSGEVVNLADLVFESANGALAASRWNTDFLSQPLSRFTNQDCLQAVPPQMGEPLAPPECRTRHGWIVARSQEVFWQDALFFTVRDGVQPIGVCPIESGRCEIRLNATVNTPLLDPAVLAPTIVDIRLLIDEGALTLVNVSGRTVDLRDLTFRSGDEVFESSFWATEFLSRPLSAFPGGDCLQVLGLEYDEAPPAPAICRFRHGWSIVNNSRDFWRTGDGFVVERNGQVLARCAADVPICEVSLNP